MLPHRPAHPDPIPSASSIHSPLPWGPVLGQAAHNQLSVPAGPALTLSQDP